jgi:3-oxoacyl-[acyl-carrier-protein] synthase-3
MAQRKQRGPNGPPRYAHIVGWGVEIPERVLTNDEIARMVETSDEWIRTRTGIRERRIADERDDTVALGLRAARKALNAADILPEELDLIICATSSPTHLFPATACFIQDKLGATKAGAFDILAACTGFIYGIGLASAQIRSGMIDTALVIGSETLSRITDWTDRTTCILFGDGAGAFVLRASDMPGGVLETVMHSDGSGGELLFAQSGMRPTWGMNGMGPQSIIEMDGSGVFRFATRIMASAAEEVIKAAGLKTSDIDLIIPHQANARIIEAAARGLKLPLDKFFINIDRYGNTSTASIPIAVAEAAEQGLLHPNDLIVLVGFGGGLTWGATLIQWGAVPVEVPRLRDLLREALYLLAWVRSLIRRLLRTIEAALFRPPPA